MRGFELLDTLKCLPLVYNQLYKLCCIDTLPAILPFRQFIIVNRDSMELQGSHWFVCIRSDEDHIEVFDSIGTNLDYVKAHFSRYSSNIEYNTTPTQDKSKITCGLHCIYFISHRVLDFDTEYAEVMSLIFESDLEKNEKKVLQYISELNDE